jgi:large subunit ribosomal protein L10
MMNKTEKVEIVSEIKEQLEKSTSVYLVDYQGISVDEINGIRRNFLKEGVNYKVFKNTLFKKALIEMEKYPELENLLEGMTGFAFTTDENYSAPAKVIKKFNDEHKKFELKGCYIESQYYGAGDLKTLASMPTKEEVMAGIVGSLQSPISGVVGAINAVMRDIVGLVDEISKQKAA